MRARFLKFFSTFTLCFLLFELGFSLFFSKFKDFLSMLLHPFSSLFNSRLDFSSSLFSSLGKFYVCLKLSNFLSNFLTGILYKKLLSLKFLSLAMKLDCFAFNLFCVSNLESFSLPLLLFLLHNSFLTLKSSLSLGSLSLSSFLSIFNLHLFSFKNFTSDLFINWIFLGCKRTKSLMNFLMGILELFLLLLKLLKIFLMLFLSDSPLFLGEASIATSSEESIVMVLNAPSVSVAVFTPIRIIKIYIINNTITISIKILENIVKIQIFTHASIAINFLMDLIAINSIFIIIIIRISSLSTITNRVVNLV